MTAPNLFAIVSLNTKILKQEGGYIMWIKPSYKVVAVCAEVTAYAYNKK